MMLPAPNEVTPSGSMPCRPLINARLVEHAAARAGLQDLRSRRHRRRAGCRRGPTRQAFDEREAVEDAGVRRRRRRFDEVADHQVDA